MSDISVSERRLLAAFDRIDQFLDRGGMVSGGSGADQAGNLQAELDAAQARIAELSGQAQPAEGDDFAGQAARLVAANDELIAANRSLIQAPSGSGDRIEAVSVALEAEIEALRAARAAEAAQLGALLAEVERLLADDAPATVANTPEIAGDAAGIPEQEYDAQAQEDR